MNTTANKQLFQR